MDILHGCAIQNRDRILAHIPCPKPYLHPDYVNIMSDAEPGGAPEFFLVTSAERFAYYQYVRRDIAVICPELEPATFFDLTTPFDYGGIHTNDSSLLGFFRDKFVEYCRDTHVVAEFVRLAPWEMRSLPLDALHWTTRHVADHVFIDLTSGPVDKRLSERRERDLRKAARRAPRVVQADGVEFFMSIYQQTMRKRGAHAYYFFDQSILDSLTASALLDIWLLEVDGEAVSGIAVLPSDRHAYYFLGGTREGSLRDGVATHLFVEVATQYRQQGATAFILGGGQGGVLQFKKGFSDMHIPYFIGQCIHDKTAYEKLVTLTKRQHNRFFPQYREKVI
ncbi:MAG: GNAT family N-acetyltransferase [Thermodesulfobacteriota bacterium]